MPGRCITLDLGPWEKSFGIHVGSLDIDLKTDIRSIATTQLKDNATPPLLYSNIKEQN